jgi:plastocyanin
MHASISLLAAVAATLAAETVVIQAGLKGFTFWPPEAVANQGDIIQFQFLYGNHTVVQSEFNTPCQWYNGGFDSGPINYKVCLSSRSHFPHCFR